MNTYTCNFARVVLSLCLLLWPAVSSAQERAPNRRDIAQQVSDADPARFACAHVESRGCKNDWIKAVAWALHQTDARWGLNMKRDNDREGLSMDVVTWRIGPTDRHVQAFDICARCGGANPAVEWADITNWATLGNPGTARWVKPEPVDGGTTPPPPPPPPTVDLSAVLAKLDALTAKLDSVAGVAVEARDLAASAASSAGSAAHDARELNARPVPVLAVPCLSGRVPKAFGGSTEVTFCPAQ